MPSSATVTVADILQLRAEGLIEPEVWALLFQSAQRLQDLFLTGQLKPAEGVPVIPPSAILCSSRGRVLLEPCCGLDPDHVALVAPEFLHNRRTTEGPGWEKMWVYSLGMTLRCSLKDDPDVCSPDLTKILEAMTYEDPASRATLMVLLNVISDNCKKFPMAKPFSHVIVDLYREVFGTPPQCLPVPESVPSLNLAAPSEMATPTNQATANDAETPKTASIKTYSRASSLGSPIFQKRRNPVQRAASRLYRPPQLKAESPCGRYMGPDTCVGPEFIVRAQESPRVVHVGDPKSPHRRSLVVLLMTGQRLEVTCGPKTTARQLFEVIVQIDNLEDNYLLGLCTLLGGDFAFLPLDVKLCKTAPSGWKEGSLPATPWFLYLRFRFLLPSLRGLRRWETKHLMYLQLRRSLLDRHVTGNDEEIINLCGLALQAEFGNYIENQHGSADYFLPEHYLPEDTISEDRISALRLEHSSRHGLDPGRAEELFIAAAQRLPDYGHHHHTGIWQRGRSDPVPLITSVSPDGICLYAWRDDGRKVHEKFTWRGIEQLSYHKDNFCISPYDVGGQESTRYKIKMDNKKSLYVFRLASFHHQMFLKLRKELCSLSVVSMQFGVPVRNENTTFHLENQVNTLQERRYADCLQERPKRRRGVKMGTRAIRKHSISDVSNSSSDAYVIEAGNGNFTVDLQESLSSELAAKLEDLSCQGMRFLKKVKLPKDKYGSIGLEVIEGSGGGVYVENILRPLQVGPLSDVNRGDQVLAVDGVCVLGRGYPAALSALKSAGTTVDVLIARAPPTTELGREYLKNIRFDMAVESDNFALTDVPHSKQQPSSNHESRPAFGHSVLVCDLCSCVTYCSSPTMSLDSVCQQPIPLPRLKKKAALKTTSVKSKAPERPPLPVALKLPIISFDPPILQIDSQLSQKKVQSIGRTQSDVTTVKEALNDYLLPDVTKVNHASLSTSRPSSRSGSYNAKEWNKIINGPDNELEPNEWAMLLSKEAEELLEVSHDRDDEVYSIRSTPSPQPYCSSFEECSINQDPVQLTNSLSIRCTPSPQPYCSFDECTINQDFVQLSNSLPNKFLPSPDSPSHEHLQGNIIINAYPKLSIVEQKSCELKMELDKALEECANGGFFANNLKEIRTWSDVKRDFIEGELSSNIKNLDLSPNSIGDSPTPPLVEIIKTNGQEGFLPVDSLRNSPDKDGNWNTAEVDAIATSGNCNSMRREEYGPFSIIDVQQLDNVSNPPSMDFSGLKDDLIKTDEVDLPNSFCDTIGAMVFKDTENINEDICYTYSEASSDSKDAVCCLIRNSENIPEPNIVNVVNKPVVPHGTNSVKKVFQTKVADTKLKSGYGDFLDELSTVLCKVNQQSKEDLFCRKNKFIIPADCKNNDDIPCQQSDYNAVHSELSSNENIVDDLNANFHKQFTPKDVPDETWKVEDKDKTLVLADCLEPRAVTYINHDIILKEKITETLAENRSIAKECYSDKSVVRNEFNDASEVYFVSIDADSNNIIEKTAEMVTERKSVINECVSEKSTNTSEVSTIAKVSKVNIDLELTEVKEVLELEECGKTFFLTDVLEHKSGPEIGADRDVREEIAGRLVENAKVFKKDITSELLMSETTGEFEELENSRPPTEVFEQNMGDHPVAVKNSNMNDDITGSLAESNSVKDCDSKKILNGNFCPNTVRPANLMGPRPYHVFLASFSLRQEQQKQERREKTDFELSMNNSVSCSSWTGSNFENDSPASAMKDNEPTSMTDIVSPDPVIAVCNTVGNEYAELPKLSDLVNFSPSLNDESMLATVIENKARPNINVSEENRTEEILLVGMIQPDLNHQDVMSDLKDEYNENSHVDIDAEPSGDEEVGDDVIAVEMDPIMTGLHCLHSDILSSAPIDGEKCERIGVSVQMKHPHGNERAKSCLIEGINSSSATFEGTVIGNISDDVSTSANEDAISTCRDELLPVSIHEEKTTPTRSPSPSGPVVSKLINIAPKVTVTPCFKSQWHSQIVRTSSPELTNEWLDPSDLWLKKMYRKELNEIPEQQEVWSDVHAKKKVRFLETVEKIPNIGYDSDNEGYSDDEDEPTNRAETPPSCDIVIYQRRICNNEYNLEDDNEKVSPSLQDSKPKIGCPSSPCPQNESSPQSNCDRSQQRSRRFDQWKSQGHSVWAKDSNKQSGRLNDVLPYSDKNKPHKVKGGNRLRLKGDASPQKDRRKASLVPSKELSATVKTRKALNGGDYVLGFDGFPVGTYEEATALVGGGGCDGALRLGPDMGSNLSRHSGKGLTGRRSQSSGNLCHGAKLLAPTVGRFFKPCGAGGVSPRDRNKFCGSLPNHLDDKEVQSGDVTPESMYNGNNNYGEVYGPSPGVQLVFQKLPPLDWVGGDQGYSSERSPEEETAPSLPPIDAILQVPFITKDNVFEVTVEKGSRGLGLSVTGGVDTVEDHPGLIRIRRLFPHQPAWECGVLQLGDILLEANGMQLTGLTNYEALEVLRTTPHSVTLLVCRPPHNELSVPPPAGEPPPPPRRDSSHAMSSSSLPGQPLELTPLPQLVPEPYGEFDITLQKVNGSLGFTLRKEDESILGHYVRALVREPALSDGRIRPGDKIVAVNGMDISPLSHEEAVQMLRQCGECVILRLYRDSAQTPVSALSPTEPHPPRQRPALRQEAVDMLWDLAVRRQSPGNSTSPRRRRLERPDTNRSAESAESGSLKRAARPDFLHLGSDSLRRHPFQMVSLDDEPASLPPLSTPSEFSHDKPEYQSAHPPCPPQTVSLLSDQEVPDKSFAETGSQGLLKWKNVVFTPEDGVDESKEITPKTTDSNHSEFTENGEVLTVELSRGWNSRLGFSLQSCGSGTCISAIYADSVAAKDGRLRPGDRVLVINDESTEDMSTNDVIDLLRKIRGAIAITILRPGPS